MATRIYWDRCEEMWADIEVMNPYSAGDVVAMLEAGDVCLDENLVAGEMGVVARVITVEWAGDTNENFRLEE